MHIAKTVENKTYICNNFSYTLMYNIEFLNTKFFIRNENRTNTIYESISEILLDVSVGFNDNIDDFIYIKFNDDYEFSFTKFKNFVDKYEYDDKRRTFKINDGKTILECPEQYYQEVKNFISYLDNMLDSLCKNEDNIDVNNTTSASDNITW